MLFNIYLCFTSIIINFFNAYSNLGIARVRPCFEVFVKLIYESWGWYYQFFPTSVTLLLNAYNQHSSCGRKKVKCRRSIVLFSIIACQVSLLFLQVFIRNGYPTKIVYHSFFHFFHFNFCRRMIILAPFYMCIYIFFSLLQEKWILKLFFFPQWPACAPDIAHGIDAKIKGVGGTVYCIAFPSFPARIRGSDISAPSSL